MNIFIDFDGTLVDIRLRHYKAYEQCVLSLGGRPLSIDEYWMLKRKDTKWRKILPMSEISASLESVFLQQFITIIESPDYLSIDELFNNSLETIKGLSGKHSLILVSLRRSHKNLIDQLKGLQVNSYFSHILSAHSDTKEGVLLKKAEAIRTIENFENGIIVGDTEADIFAAKQLKIPVVAVLSGIRDRDFLSRLEPDYLIDSIADIEEVINKSIFARSSHP